MDWANKNLFLALLPVFLMPPQRIFPSTSVMLHGHAKTMAEVNPISAKHQKLTTMNAIPIATLHPAIGIVIQKVLPIVIARIWVWNPIAIEPATFSYS